MKKIIVLVVLLGLVLTGCSTKSENKPVIGVLQLAEHRSLDATYEGLVEVLDEKLGKDNYSINLKNAQGNMSNVQIIAEQFVKDGVDIIYAIGTNAAQTAFNVSEGTDTVVVFNAVTDPVAAGLVSANDSPGERITGVSDISPAKKQFALVKELLPEAKTVGIVYNIAEVNSKVQIDTLTPIAKEMGIEIISQGVSSMQDLSLAAKQLASKVDAFYNTTDNMVVSATSTIVDIANQQGIPVFASEDGAFEDGILATESLSYLELGKRGGDIVYDIISGAKKVVDIPVVISEETNLHINEEVAKKLGIVINEGLKSRMIVRD